MAGKTLLAFSICIYGSTFYSRLILQNYPVEKNLDKMTMFMDKDHQTSSHAKNTENSYLFSAQANRLTKASNVSCWYIIQTMEVKLILKEEYLRRRLVFTPTSIATFNPIIYHLELTLQTLTGDHAAHCYFGSTTDGSRTSTTMDDFDPITVFNLPEKGLKIVRLNTRSITNKLDQIRLMMHKKCINILAITETWLDNS